MTPYGKTAQHAIAAASLLAQVYHERRKLSSMEIAAERGLPKPVVAKVLTVLSQAGIVKGAPGPGGGYALAKPPEKITLFDVAECFDRQDNKLTCPFGPSYCGSSHPCPLHHQLLEIHARFTEFLNKNTLASFAKRGKSKKSMVV